MTLDIDQCNKELFNPCEEWQIYLCTCGDVKVESRHYRFSFSPQEFVELLRKHATRPILTEEHGREVGSPHSGRRIDQGTENHRFAGLR